MGFRICNSETGREIEMSNDHKEVSEGLARAIAWGEDMAQESLIKDAERKEHNSDHTQEKSWDWCESCLDAGWVEIDQGISDW